MRGTAVVRYEDLAAPVKHEQLTERGFSGQGEHAAGVDLVRQPFNRRGFLRGAGKANEEIGETIE